MRATRIGCSAMSSAMRHPPSRWNTDMLLARRDGERDRLRVAVEQVHVARAAGERARRVDAIADVLHAGRRVARDDAPLGLVVEAERGNALVLAVEDSGLAVRRCRRQAAEPAAQRVAFLADHLARSSGSIPARSRAAARRTPARRSAASRDRAGRRPVAARGETRDISARSTSERSRRVTPVPHRSCTALASVRSPSAPDSPAFSRPACFRSSRATSRSLRG